MSGELGITLRGDGSQLKAVLQQAGADVDKFAAQAGSAGAATGKAFDYGTQSAKQLAFNLRGIPAQFTDIFVSLEAGQSPLTVFLQQGGQLKDMFGGVIPAAKAMGGYILSLIGPYTVAAAAVGALGYAWYKGSQEAHEYTKAILLSGNAAGVTAYQLQDSAARMSKSVGISQGAAAEALALLTRNGNIASRDFESFGATAVNMQKLTGAAVADTVKQFAELGKDPLTATLKLNETTNYLTTSVYDQIKALTEQGKTLEAGVVAQHAYMDAMNARMPQLKENLGLIQKAWGGVGEAAKDAWNWMLGLGRTVDPTTAIKQSIAAIEAKIADNVKNGSYNPGYLVENIVLKEKLAMLKEGLSISQKAQSMAAAGAQQTAAENIALDAHLAFEKTIDQYKGKQVQKEEELLKLSNQYSALKDPTTKQAEDFLNAYTQIEKKFADFDPGKVALSKIIDALEQQQTAIVESEKRTQDGLKKQYDRGEISTRDYYTSREQYALDANAKNIKVVQQEIEAVQKGNLALTEKAEKEKGYNIELKKLTEERKNIIQKASDDVLGIGVKETLAANEAHNKYIAGILSGTDKINAETKQIKEQTAEYGLSKDVIEALRGAELERQATTLEGIAIRALDHTGVVDGIMTGEAEYIITMREVQALRDKAAAMRALGNQQVIVDTAKKAEEEWKKTSEHISNQLTDALLRGFEAGKTMAENFRDTLVNMFKTMILRPLIKVIFDPISMVGATLMGTMGTAAAGGVAGSAGTGMLGAFAGSALMTTATSWGTAAGAGFMATLGGSSISGGAAAGILATGGASGAGTAGMIGAAGPWALAAVAAYMLLKGGGESQTGQGITGKFGSTGFVGNSYAEMTNKPGLLRGWLGANDNVYKNLSPLDAATQYQLSTAFDAMKTQTAAYAEALGLGADSIKGYSKDITLAFTADAAANQKLVADTLSGIAADLANGVFGTTGATTRTVTSKVIDQAGGWQGGMDGAYIADTWREITTTVTEGTSVVAQYAHGLETADQTLARLATSLTGVNAMFRDLGYTLLDKGLTGASKASNLVDSFGGLAQAQTAMNGYYQLFYSAADQTANLTRNTAAAFAALNIPMPAVNAGLRAWYRGIVDNLGAQDMGVKANADAYAGAVNLYGAIDKLAPASTAASDAAQKLTDSLTATNVSLQDQYDVLTGLKTQRDIDTRGYTDAQAAIYDHNTALQASIDAFKTTEQATKDFAATLADTFASLRQGNTDLANQLLVAQGNQAQATANERAAELATATAGVDFMAAMAIQAELINKWNLQDAITAANAANAASNATTATTDYTASVIAVDTVLQALTSTNASLADQYNKLTMSAAAYRDYQISGMTAVQAAMYDSNAAIQVKIDTYNQEAAAAKAATAAADALAATNKGWQDQFDVLTGKQTDRSIALRDATDDTTKVLMRQVYAQQDLKAAATALATANKGWADKNYAALDPKNAQQVQMANDLAAATDSTTKELIKQYYAQLNLNDAATKAAAVATAIANEKKSLQDQLDQATMTSTELLAKQRGALDVSNRGLFDQVQAATAAAQALAAMKSVMDGLSTTHASLQVQLLTAQGDTTGAMALKRSTELAVLTDKKTASEVALITASYNANAALEDQITAANAAAQAAQAAAAAQAQAAQQAQQAADQLKSAWQSVTDSIFAEVQRIQGITGTSAQSYAQAQAEFAITTAQARAGDQGAAKLLPGLSQALLTLAETNAASLYELQRIQGQTAGSLATTGHQYASQYGLTLPSFAVGTDYVPRDMVAKIHQGERITPAAFNRGTNNARLEALVEALREEVRALRSDNSAENRAAIGHAARTARLLDRAMPDGDALATRAAV